MISSGTFAKRDPSAPAGFFEAEAAGLRWLAEARDGVPVVRVLAVAPGELVLERLRPHPCGPASADALGRQLAATHRCGADCWGRSDGDGFIGPLTLANGPFSSWAEMWWAGRVEPFLHEAVDNGLLTAGDARTVGVVVARLAPDVPAIEPSRLHGDLWSGNVVWTAAGAVLIDGGAAHGGQREADLAMLALFGLPHLQRVLAAYDEAWPMESGWRERVALFQLHPLLVHVVLFGASYVPQLRATVARLG